jgi:hypothetical protein
VYGGLLILLNCTFTCSYMLHVVYVIDHNVRLNAIRTHFRLPWIRWSMWSLPSTDNVRPRHTSPEELFESLRPSSNFPLKHGPTGIALLNCRSSINCTGFTPCYPTTNCIILIGIVLVFSAFCEWRFRVERVCYRHYCFECKWSKLAKYVPLSYLPSVLLP